MGEVTQKKGGLAEIVVGESAICFSGGEEDTLLYRGYPIEALAEQATFEEVAWLLLRGELPTYKELEGYRETLACGRELPVNLKAVLEQVPRSANMMDLLRTGCSALGHFEPEQKGSDPYAVADRLIASFGSMLLYWYQLHQTGKRIELRSDEPTLAGHLLQLLGSGGASESHRQCLNVSLILYAEHEFNASTLAVRTIASTMSDFYSAICGGIGALRGPLHSGANAAVMALIERCASPEEAESAVKEMLAKEESIMGFGHRIYKRSDPRSSIIKEWAKRLSFAAGDPELFAIAERIEQVVANEKGLFPTVDFYSTLAYLFCGVPQAMFTPFFLLSRIAGWSAHLLEQRADNQLMRPVSDYVGPQPRSWVPLDQR